MTYCKRHRTSSFRWEKQILFFGKSSLSPIRPVRHVIIVAWNFDSIHILFIPRRLSSAAVWSETYSKAAIMVLWNITSGPASFFFFFCPRVLLIDFFVLPMLFPVLHFLLPQWLSVKLIPYTVLTWEKNGRLSKHICIGFLYFQLWLHNYFRCLQLPRSTLPRSCR